MADYSAALYIHIPFCTSKCDYCDFFSITDYSCVNETINAVVSQIEQEKTLYGIKDFSSVYIGGGTPGSLSPELIVHLMKALFRINGDRLPDEVTMECNPVNVNIQSLALWQSRGINRISLGVQTFQDQFLKRAGRLSSEKSIREAISLIRNHPAFTLSLDLIQGLPGMTRQDQIHDLQEAVNCRADHISWYSLTLESGTALSDSWEKRQSLSVTEEEEEKIWQEGCLFLEKEGFQRYEVSNFARPGRECEHNKAYWQMRPFLGVGPGAVSMVRNTSGFIERHRILRDVKNYAACIFQMEDREIISPRDFLKDYFLMGLRMKQGVNICSFRKVFGQNPEEYIPCTVQANLENGNMQITEDSLLLTTRGLDLLNTVLVEIFTELDELSAPEVVLWPVGEDSYS